MRITVCIITFRRPKGLRVVLEALARQTCAEDAPAVSVLVVDNDGEGSARAVVEEVRPPATIGRSSTRWRRCAGFHSRATGASRWHGRGP